MLSIGQIQAAEDLVMSWDSEQCRRQWVTPGAVHIDKVAEVGDVNKWRQLKCYGGSEKREIGINGEKFM